MRESTRKTKRYTCVPVATVAAVIDRVAARDALGTLEEVAHRLGLSRRMVYHITTHYRRKVRVPEVPIIRCEECPRRIRSGRHCAECSRSMTAIKSRGVDCAQ